MSAKLISRGGEIRGEFELGSEATLGRGPKNSVVLKPELLSNRHARIWHDPEVGCYMLEDLGSSNGTRLDGSPVKRKEPLGHLHVITFAEHYDFIFVDARYSRQRHSGQGLAAAPVAEAVAIQVVGESSEVTLLERLPMPLPDGFGQESETERRERTIMEKLPLPLPGFLRPEAPIEEEEEPSAAGLAGPKDRGSSPGFRPPSGPHPTESDVAALMADRDAENRLVDPIEKNSSPSAPVEKSSFGDTFFLEIITEEGPTRHRLKIGENLVGRDPRANIRPTSPEVSRRHALFTASPGRLMVKDLGSRNKTFVEEREISDSVELRPGQRVRFGALEARVLDTDGWEDDS